MPNPHPVELGLCQGLLQRFLHVRGRHRGGELPRQDVARVVVQHRRQVVPAPALDLEVGEVGLPQLVHPPGGLGEPIGGGDQLEGRALDQVEALQEPEYA